MRCDADQTLSFSLGELAKHPRLDDFVVCSQSTRLSQRSVVEAMLLAIVAADTAALVAPFRKTGESKANAAYT